MSHRREPVRRTRLRAAALVAGLATLALLAPGPAQAQTSTSLIALGGGRLVSEVHVPFTASGSLTVAYHGDGSAGCAAAGTCAYSGTIVAPGPGSGDVIILAQRHGARTSDQVITVDNQPFTAGPQTISVVERALPGGGSARCGDTVPAGSPFQSAIVRRAAVTFRLLQAGTQLLGTRCAGPTDAALAPVSPSVTVPIGTLRRGRRVLNLTDSESFSADGFAGTLTSTVVIRLGAPHIQRLNSAPTFPPGIKLVRARTILESLRVIAAGGALQAHVAGAGPDVCPLLDSCGLTETLSWSPAAADSAGSLFVTAPATTARARLLAGLGLARTRGPIGASGAIMFTDPRPAVVVSDQATQCHGATGPQTMQLGFSTQRGRVLASLSTSSSLRSGCPGPFLGGGSSQLTLATGRLPVSALGRRTVTLRLHAVRTALPDDGYTSRLTGTVTLSLRRGAITQRIERVPSGF